MQPDQDLDVGRMRTRLAHPTEGLHGAVTLTAYDDQAAAESSPDASGTGYVDEERAPCASAECYPLGSAGGAGDDWGIWNDLSVYRTCNGGRVAQERLVVAS